MNTSQQKALASFLSSIFNADFVEVRGGESLEATIERVRADHRAECPACAGKYAREQTAEQAEQAEQVAKKQAFEQAAMKQAFERATNQQAGLQTENVGITAATEHKDTMNMTKREPLGYMAFAERDGKLEPIAPSFNVDQQAVQAKLDEFNAAPVLQLMVNLGLMTKAEVRPVFAD